MAERPRVLIPGGSGVFGRLLARELIEGTEAEVIVAGRDVGRAVAVCAALGSRATPMHLDLTDPDGIARAARDCVAVACCAGPFQALSPALIDAVTEAGAHWLDIADDTGWVGAALARAATDRAVMPGLSSIPLLAMVLLRRGLERVPDAERARAGLFIGNRNAKGVASIASAITTGFGEPERIRYPFGVRLGYRFDAPFDALARGLGVDAGVYVTLGSRLAGRLVRSASPLLANRAASAIARAASIVGARGGAVVVEAAGATGAHTACLVGSDQRFAILPIAIVIEELLAGRPAVGAIEASTWMAHDAWTKRLCARGLRLFELSEAGTPARPAR